MNYKTIDCGCWIWCDDCKGDGIMLIYNRVGSYLSLKERIDCTTCKGNPPHLKWCQACAKRSGFLEDKTATKRK